MYSHKQGAVLWIQIFDLGVLLLLGSKDRLTLTFWVQQGGSMSCSEKRNLEFERVTLRFEVSILCIALQNFKNREYHVQFGKLPDTPK